MPVEFGRIREYPAAPVPWLSDVTDAKYVLSDMIQKVINDNMPIEDAQSWAQQQPAMAMLVPGRRLAVRWALSRERRWPRATARQKSRSNSFSQ